MTIRAAHQRSTSYVAGAAHPFGGPTHASGSGMPMGIYYPTNEAFYFDPFIEKVAGRIASTCGLVLGQKGHGKSGALKIIALRLAMVSAGDGLMRIAVNDHKSEGAESEYAAFGRYLGCDTYDIATRSVNPFESALKLGELNALEMATLLCEHVAKRRLEGSDFVALKVGVFKMLCQPEPLWTTQYLLKTCQSLTVNDIQLYYANMHDRMRGQLLDRVERLSMGTGEKDEYITGVSGIYERSDNLNYAEIIHSGEAVANLLATLLEGRYGRMFGGEDSFYKMLSRRAIIKDWRGVTGDGVSLMRAIDYWIQINAIERGHTDLYPNIVLDDEDHRSMENLTYARAKAHLSKILRSAQLLSLSGSHRLSDYRKGGAGSELWGYGKGVIDDTSFFLVGQQPNDKEVLDELQARLELSNLDRRTLIELPPHVFGLKLGTERLVYVQFLPTPTELKLMATDSAVESVTARPGIYPAGYARVARATGYELRDEA